MKIFIELIQGPLVCYGFEHLVEYQQENEIILFDTASNKEYNLPIFRNATDSVEDGEVDETERFPSDFIKFFEALMGPQHLADSLRIENFKEFNKRSNWPWNSMIEPKKSKKEELETLLIFSLFFKTFFIISNFSLSELRQNVSNDKLREKWRVMEDKKGRDAIFEFCQEETKTYTEIKIANLLNRIKVCCTPEEYAMEK